MASRSAFVFLMYFYQELARIFHKKAQTSCKSLIEWYV